MKSKIIAVANHKGGVGKTASVASNGAILASHGKKVLLVYLDTQANLTRHFMESIPPRTIYHAIRVQSNLPIYPIRPNLDIVPSGLDMAGIDPELLIQFKTGCVSRTHLVKRTRSTNAAIHKHNKISEECTLN